ncbi:MAG: dTDP-4-amino-4,6-dideoxygalactose transaminase [Actinobacteria bacterium]|nr:dTDP-4-amino-4,6-dideoxygalactose transaminase [Actinomycetota bacterium]
MNNKNIDFNNPVVMGNEINYVIESINSVHISGDGPFTKKVHSLLEKEIGVSKVLLTTSCTHALEMMAILLRLKPGDEVIFPDFTFVSTVNAFVLHGAKPVFVDVRPDTLNINEKKLESVISSKTRAVVPVHYAGVACEMDFISEITNNSKKKIAIFEDNAHGLFGKYKGKYLGTFGDLAAQSFHETKNFSCGEGGALLINNNLFIERAEIIREKGTNRSLFFRGQVDKYSWVDIGSSYLPSDILAAYLYGQLEQREKIQNHRMNIWNYYYDGLKDWSYKKGFQLPKVPFYCEQAYHMFYLLLPNLKIRQKFIQYLRENGIYCVFHYLPLHKSKMGRNYVDNPKNFPITDRVSNQIVRLPFHNALTKVDIDYVLENIYRFNY